MRKVNVNAKEFNVNDKRPEFWNQVESGQWESETFKAFDCVLEAGKTFIDIGAWNGVTSLYAHASGCKVIAVEPDRQVLGELLNNFSLNEIPHDRVYNSAIGHQNGMVNLFTSSAFGDSMSSLLCRQGMKGVEEVASLTLETFVEANHIDMSEVCLIKIDIEGGEVLMLSKAKEFLAKHKPNIHLSLHPFWYGDEWNTDNGIAIIREIIFQIYQVWVVTSEDMVYIEEGDFTKLVKEGCYSFMLTARK